MPWRVASVTAAPDLRLHVTFVDGTTGEVDLQVFLSSPQAGRSVTVLERETPLVRIVPYEGQGSSLTVRHPLPGAPSLKRVPLPPPMKLRRHIVELLLEECQGER